MSLGPEAASVPPLPAQDCAGPRGRRSSVRSSGTTAETAMRAYVDRDVLIWHLRGETRAAKLFRSLANEGSELWTGALQRAEIVFLMRAPEERATLAFLSRFKTEPVTQAIVDLAGVFYRKWNPSHSIDGNDALLAATAALTGGKINTLNLRHYPMGDVAVLKAW